MAATYSSGNVDIKGSSELIRQSSRDFDISHETIIDNSLVKADVKLYLHIELVKTGESPKKTKASEPKNRCFSLEWILRCQDGTISHSGKLWTHLVKKKRKLSHDEWKETWKRNGWSESWYRLNWSDKIDELNTYRYISNVKDDSYCKTEKEMIDRFDRILAVFEANCRDLIFVFRNVDFGDLCSLVTMFDTHKKTSIHKKRNGILDNKIIIDEKVVNWLLSETETIALKDYQN